METAIKQAKAMLLSNNYVQMDSSSLSGNIMAGKVAFKPLLNLMSIGNTEISEFRLLEARLALKMTDVTEGYLVYTEDNQVKYYSEEYSFTAIHLATFTNLPVYCILQTE